MLEKYKRIVMVSKEGRRLRMFSDRLTGSTGSGKPHPGVMKRPP
jgi:hypothetical protein